MTPKFLSIANISGYLLHMYTRSQVQEFCNIIECNNKIIWKQLEYPTVRHWITTFSFSYNETL